ncbi:MAG: nuclear transport factor 2 family protein, partial [Bacteroidota bacterium]
MSFKQNKENAIAFYKTAFLGNAGEAIEKYVGDDYIQHNPDVEDGKKGFIEYFDRMQEGYADKSIEFVRAVAEGDLVALHTHQTWPGNDQYITMDFFRFDENGKIVEHWDAI